jgi:hypothetical protein
LGPFESIDGQEAVPDEGQWRAKRATTPQRALVRPKQYQTCALPQKNAEADPRSPFTPNKAIVRVARHCRTAWPTIVARLCRAALAPRGRYRKRGRTWGPGGGPRPARAFFVLWDRSETPFKQAKFVTFFFLLVYHPHCTQTLRHKWDPPGISTSGAASVELCEVFYALQPPTAPPRNCKCT